MTDASVGLPDLRRDRVEEEQALGLAVPDDLSDEAETIPVADGTRILGAGEFQVKDVHIFELEGGPARRFGTLVPGSDQDVVSSVGVAMVGHVRDRAIELNGPAAVFGREGCDRLIAVVRDAQKRANSSLLLLVSTWSASGPVDLGAWGADGWEAVLLGSASWQERSIVSRGALDTASPAAGHWPQTRQFDSLMTPKAPPPSTLTASSKPASLIALLAASSL